ncbi:FtsX-like permease family protein [Mucilaginibacter celer]|uniref:FtsX-like permease family protein n=2 Tax=Mucilaginibacter celer TaxID=2305508 RepID=A0A494W0K3_9SPHI|nr:FtsX-like permease family protein [Mucilaginibacter celer]
MIRNYIKTAFRSLRKNVGFTAINILGLSVGLATCLLIVLFVADELSYDKYNTKADRIFRITENVRLNGREGSYAGSPEPFKNALQGNFPEIEKIARMIPTSSLFLSPQKYYFRNGNENIQERNVVFAESDLFDVFTLPMIDGTPANSLTEPHSAVITESTAKKYFNRVNVVGQTLTVNDTGTYKITGVVKDIPSQSHFKYDFFLSFSSIPESRQHGWGFSGVHNYLLLKPGTNVKNLEAQITQIDIKNSFNPKAWTTGGNYLHTELKPVTDIHLRSVSEYEFEKGGSMQYVYIFSIIAVFILAIACVNFMNLSTARSANRAKEVGVRKVLGSARKNLIAQFLTESLLVTLFSTIVAIVIAWALMPLFNQMSGKGIAFNPQSAVWLLPSLVVVVLVVGFLAGLYPAFVLSAFRPIEVLKGKLATGFKGSFLRGFLVVFQFSISIFLIIGTLVIYNQLNFIHNKNLGFDRSQVLVVKNTNVLGKQAKILKQEIGRMPGVINATMSLYTPTGQDRNMTGLFPDKTIDIKKDMLTEFWPVDENYINTMGIKMLSGRNFSTAMATDTAAIIGNEAFVKVYGEKAPLNKTVYRDTWGVQPYHIVGVMKDFNFSSLKDKIGPVVLAYADDYGAISVRIKASNISAFIEQVQNKWKELAPNHQFTYSFMDEDFDATYRSEHRIGQLFISFSTLAILIACLGLFGLAAYAAEQRNKEIGIRKVLGASVTTIVGMLSKDFIKLVFISILISSPLAWFMMSKWLQGFAYRINIQWWVLAVAGVLAVLIAFVTISFQSIRAALANPVKSLKNE